MEKFKLRLDVFVCGHMPQILVFGFSLVTLEFSIHNFFKTRMLLEIFDAEFPYKLSYFEPLCQLNKKAAKTVKRLIELYLIRLLSLRALENSTVEPTIIFL